MKFLVISAAALSLCACTMLGMPWGTSKDKDTYWAYCKSQGKEYELVLKEMVFRCVDPQPARRPAPDQGGDLKADHGTSSDDRAGVPEEAGPIGAGPSSRQP
jgi:hypothetical protein